MIEVSEDAQNVVRRLLIAAGKPEGGLRVAAVHDRVGRETESVDVAIVDAPAAADRILDVGGVRLFLDPQALALADGAELIAKGGELELVLPARPATAP